MRQDKSFLYRARYVYRIIITNNNSTFDPCVRVCVRMMNDMKLILFVQVSDNLISVPIFYKLKIKNI